MFETSRPLLALAACILPLTLYTTPAQSDNEDERTRACVTSLSQTLARQLSDNDYPRDLQESDTQGTVLVQLSLERSGKVGPGAVAQTSGSAALDQAALRAVQRVFPRASAAPVECKLEAEFLVTLPLRFKVSVIREHRQARRPGSAATDMQ